MRVSLLGLGTALPAHAISQELVAAGLCRLVGRNGEEARRVRTLFRLAGVRSRRSVVLEADGDTRPQAFYQAGDPDALGPSTAARMQRYALEAPALALPAAAAALAEAGVATGDVDHLVLVTCTGFAAPGLDVPLIERLGLRDTVARTQVGFMGCHGAINGLRVARAYAAEGSRVLLVAVELCSLHLQYGLDEGQAVANALFADGAAAAVIGEGGGPALLGTGSRVFAHSADAMTWRIGDHGFEMTLSAGVPGLIETHLRPWLSGWLAEHGLTVEQVGSWAAHPGGPRILDAVEAALGLPRAATAASRAVLAELGNMSSPTVLFVLDRLRRAGAAWPCVLLGFGPGLTAEAALIG